MHYLKRDSAKPLDNRLPAFIETNDGDVLRYALRSMVEITKEEYDLLERREEIKSRITELKKLLANSDYISCKIAEGAATREEYAEIIAQRQAWRNEINQLEQL